MKHVIVMHFKSHIYL